MCPHSIHPDPHPFSEQDIGHHLKLSLLLSDEEVHILSSSVYKAGEVQGLVISIDCQLDKSGIL